jgi:hypothetical protein
LIDGGFFPKLVAPRPDWLKVASVVEICSVSECVSPGPPDWIKQWLHNSWGWFNCMKDALRVVPPAERGKYRLFAYRLHSDFWRDGAPVQVIVPSDVTPEPTPRTFRSLGFDAANSNAVGVLGLECSPLSCNSGAEKLPANEHCLFSSLDAAIAGARDFSSGNWEPGDYYVVEVLEGAYEAAEQGDEADER